jgi:hypothetical protein
MFECQFAPGPETSGAILDTSWLDSERRPTMIRPMLLHTARHHFHHRHPASGGLRAD